MLTWTDPFLVRIFMLLGVNFDSAIYSIAVYKSSKVYLICA